MTAFVPANIPSNVNTLEELAAWSCAALAEINNTAEIATGPGQLEPVVTMQTFRYANQATNPERLICVMYLPLLPGWRSLGKLFHAGVGEISGAALPVAYTVN